ncbi:hypothetical protein C3920_09780 [Novacetimonas pomaceti]|uniref:Transposase IS4-like domain-containing protein n=1 Tax=Novacetimonas pomaceti TaxID=2021998 RepID=A0ABX5P2P0_9PROT|nr:hypothetical protein C3920_09780 [Novacetimonas pomaceti]
MTIVRAHQRSAGARKKGSGSGIGRSRGGLTTKIHAVVDAAGKPLALSLMPGQRAGITEAEPFMDEVDPAAFIADKAYDAAPLIEKLGEQQIASVIPSRENSCNPRKLRLSLYKKRNEIERFCARLKQFRRKAKGSSSLRTNQTGLLVPSCWRFGLEKAVIGIR